jgi:hypothetical protein
MKDELTKINSIIRIRNFDFKGSELTEIEGVVRRFIGLIGELFCKIE